VSIAALRPAAIVFREEQNFPRWVYALLGVIAFAGTTFAGWHGQGAPGRSWWAEVPAVLLVSVALPAVLVLGVLRMTTEVAPGGCAVWFGWIPSYRRLVLLDTIQRIEIVEYRPWADYRGWGARTGRDGERVLIARGNRGVRLHMVDGSRLLIGSQRPEDLAQALEHAIRPVV
jgi:hypothetical protein